MLDRYLRAQPRRGTAPAEDVDPCALRAKLARVTALKKPGSPERRGEDPAKPPRPHWQRLRDGD